MIEKTEAIVLRYYPYSNTSRIVSWLTPSGGRIATIIKGSQRPRSAFLGQYDLFYTCELVFYARRHSGLHIARECAPIRTRDRFRADWKAAAAASYLCDLTSRISPPDAPHAGLFEVLETGLNHLAASGAAPAFLFWYELKLLATLGFEPRLRHCLDCDRELQPGARHSKFSYARGGILCANCAEAHAEGAVPITPDILAMLAAWQRAHTPQYAFSTQCTSWQLGEIQKLLGLFLTYHLDTPLNSRRLALETLAYRAA